MSRLGPNTKDMETSVAIGQHDEAALMVLMLFSEPHKISVN